jgi:hypothetical protein
VATITLTRRRRERRTSGVPKGPFGVETWAGGEGAAGADDYPAGEERRARAFAGRRMVTGDQQAGDDDLVGTAAVLARQCLDQVITAFPAGF